MKVREQILLDALRTIEGGLGACGTPYENPEGGGEMTCPNLVEGADPMCCDVMIAKVALRDYRRAVKRSR